MSLREVLAELDVQVRGAQAVRAANVDLDRYVVSSRAAATPVEQLKLKQMEAAELASRLAGRIRLLQRAEGDNSREIEQTRIAMLRAQEEAASYGTTLDRLARQARGSATAFQGSVASFGGGNFGLSPSRPSLLSSEGLASVRAGMMEFAPAIAAGAAAFYGIERAADAAAAQIREVVREGDEINDTAARLNVSAHALQEWNYIAESTGTSADAIQRAFPAIARSLAGAHGAQVFHELGVSVRDASGAMRSQEDILGDTVAAINRIHDPTRQAELAQRAFGRAGQELLPLIRSAPGDIDRLRRRFAELGGGLSDDVVENANEAEQAFIDFDLATDGARATLANTFLPAIAEGITSLAGFVGKMREAWETSSGGETVLIALTSAAEGFGGVLLVAVSPLLLLGGIAVTAFLAIEDLVTAMRGGRSVIGTFFHGLEADALETAASVVAAAMDMERALGLPTGDTAEAFGAVQSRAVAARARATADTAGLQESIRGTLPAPAAAGAAAEGSATVVAPTTFHITEASDAAGVARAVDQRMRQRHREAADALAAARPARAR